jgi:hypothetical protein
MNSFSEQLKPHKTVEQIAKKHRMDVSFIQKQLDMGEPIEHEHTKDHTLAMDIALQHLDEIPDYYTRLKKMEASAKKEHKKFKDVKEALDEQRYCPLCDKRETRSECSYGGKAWDKVSVKDHEYSMARSELATMSDAIKRLQKKMGKGEGNIEAWVQSKITKAADYIDTAADYVASGEMSEAANPAQQAAIAINMKKKGIKPKSEVDEACWVGYKQEGLKKKGKRMVPNCVPKLKEHRGIVAKILEELQEESKSGDSSLHDWFSKSKSSDGKPGWVQLGGKYAGKSCAKQPGQTTKPKCGSSKMSAEMSPEEEDSAAKRKRREDPNPDRSGQAKNVATEEFVNEDACKEKVKSRYKIWPSAYASGALVKCRKVGAGNWGNKTKNEDVTIEDANGNTFAEVVDIIKPEPIKGFKQQVDEATRLPAATGNIISVMLNWRGKTYGTKMFFPQTKLPSRKDIEYEIQKVYPDCRILTYKVAEFVPGQALIYVDNTKSKNYLMNNKTIGEETIEEVAAWQRKEGKNPEGGLNAKGIASYRRENPGSKLSMAVTTPPSKLDPDSKPAKRRKSFCARMGGMPGPMKDEKGRPTRKALSLRKWNC